MMLDRSRPFATIYGFTHYGVKYLQDGKEFDVEGKELIFSYTQKRMRVDSLYPNLTHDNIDKLHRNGIDSMKESMQAGVKLPLIEVNEKGQITSGFKRYNAHKELGYEWMDVIEIKVEKS